MGVTENRGSLFGGPYNKDPTIYGSIFGPPIFGNSHMNNCYQGFYKLGRALGHFIFSLIGPKRILFTNIFQKL